MLGLPEGVRACLFDLDGVLTRHRQRPHPRLAADVRRVPARAGAPTAAFVPFDPGADYQRVRRRQDPAGRRARRSSPAGDRAARGRPGRRARRRDRARPGQPQERAVPRAGARRTASACSRARGATCRPQRTRGSRGGRVLERQHADVLQVTGLAPYVQQRVDGVDHPRAHLAGQTRAGHLPARRRAAGRAAGRGRGLRGRAGRRGRRPGRAFGFVVGVDRVGQRGRAARARRRRRRRRPGELLEHR